MVQFYKVFKTLPLPHQLIEMYSFVAVMEEERNLQASQYIGVRVSSLCLGQFIFYFSLRLRAAE